MPTALAWLDFGNLPGYAEQRLLRSAASALGLQDPYLPGSRGRRRRFDRHRRPAHDQFFVLRLSRPQSPSRGSRRARAAIDRYGVSAGASRLVAGERPVHRALEAALADHYGQDACLTFVSGHAANVSTIGALLGPRDLVVHDALAHNSIVMGAQLSARTGAPFRTTTCRRSMRCCIGPRGRYERALIVAEGLYSMDGDVCDLPGLVELKERHQAWLMIDDAHGLGVLGRRGRGVFEHFGVDPRRVDIWMGTLSKTLAACGGYIAGDAALVDFLKHAAGGFVYSVGMSPPIAAAALAALEILHREPDRPARLRERAQPVRRGLPARRGSIIGDSVGEAIIPVMTGEFDPRRGAQSAAGRAEHQRPADHRPGRSGWPRAAQVLPEQRTRSAGHRGLWSRRSRRNSRRWRGPGWRWAGESGPA